MPKHLKSFLSSFRRDKEIGKAEDHKDTTVAKAAQPAIRQRCSLEIFEPKDLWQSAYNQLDETQQQILSRAQTFPESEDKKLNSRDLIDEIVQVTKEQYEEHQQKSDKTLRKTSRKIIDALLSYNEIISAVAGLDPTQHAASAWAVVSLSLRTTKNHYDARNALFESSEYLADVITQCAFFEQKFYLDGHPDIRGNMEAAIINLYKAILRYSAQIWNSQQSGIGRNFSDCFTAITGHPLTELQNSVEKERENLRRWIELGGHLKHEKEAENILLKIDELGESVRLLLEQSSLMHLHVVEGALYDSYAHEHEDFCLPGTRTELLSRIADWANGDNKFIFWLNGMAGTGKSTIARTVARQFKDQGFLGATFFFKRGEASRGTAAYFITSIAGQLVNRHRQLVPEVLTAMKTDPSITSKFLRDQFEQLLYQPLLKLQTNQKTTIAIVIDALDECDGDNDVRLILHLLFKLQEIKSVRLRIVLTSRPELPIRIGFKEEENHQDLILHEIPRPVIENDIRQFLEYKLTGIRNSRSLSPDWPGPDSIEKLVTIAVPLFISASTACLSIGKGLHPQKQLQKYLDIGATNATQMDKTYLPALRQLMRDDEDESQEILEEFREIVGVIILLDSPLSVDSLALLLQRPADEISDLLEFLHSVLNVPRKTTNPVRILHLSFREFLLDTKSEFRIDETETHRQILSNCLRVMKMGPRHNICDLPSHGALWRDISPQVIQQRVPAHLQYSCLYWVHHLQQSPHSIPEAEIFSFLQKRFLHWLEALALMGEISQAAGMIKTLESIVGKGEDPAISSFLCDAGRFALQNAHMASIAPMQLYCSGLVFSPAQSIIRRTFISEISKHIQPLPVVMNSWSANIRTLHGHTDSIESVAFSPDGSTLASASYKTIKIWDTATGTQLQTLEGHLDAVLSVAFSPDGTVLASGSFDKTIKIWNMDISTKPQLQTLAGHSNTVTSVVFSPDGRTIASGSFDKTIRIWDTVTGTQLKMLEDHSHEILSLALSPNGLILASCSIGTTSLWDFKTGTQQQTLDNTGACFASVAFSPDGLTVALSNQYDIELWDVATALRLQTLKGDSGFVSSVTYSPDGFILASGTLLGAIQLWSTTTNTRKQRLEGHSETVVSVAFTPDGLTLASCSTDKTIMLWDTASIVEQQTPESSSPTVDSMAFSPNGVILASGANDGVIKLWDTATGTQQQTLKAHSKGIWSLAFSPDGVTLASGSADDSIWLWNITTGAKQQITEGDLHYIRSMVFSPNGLTLASNTSDYSIKVWDTTTGIRQRIIEGHENLINTLAFSPDGITLASGSDDKTIKIWNAATGVQLQRLEGHSSGVLSVAFCPDGLTLVSGSLDYTIKLWDLATGMQKQTLEGYETWMRSVTFAPQKLMSDLGIASSDYRISLSRNWVTSGDENVLWLPSDYRSFFCQAVKDGKLALGYKDGRVLIMGFQKDVK